MSRGELLTREQAAARLRVGVRQLHNLADSGALPRLRNGRGEVRYPADAVDQLAADREEFREAG